MMQLRPLLVVLACLIPQNVGAQGVQQAKPWLGVAIDKGKQGVLIKQTLQGTPAEKAGFKADDEILAVDDKVVKTPEELIKTIQSKGVGHTVKVDYTRGGKKAQLKVQLVARPDTMALMKSERVDRPAPDFELPLVTTPPGEEKSSVKLSELKGKVVVLEFWATWCPACVSTHPRLKEVQQKWKDKGFEVLAISDEEAGTLQQFVKVKKPGFTILRDDKHAAYKNWYVPAIPTLAVIDRKGIVRHATVGAGRYLDETLAIAEKLLAEK